MPKGQPSGNPTNIVCWLVGGHYNGTVWGISYDRDNLLDEIGMNHYRNKRAEEQGVRILGITETSQGDELVQETYELVYGQEQPPAFAVYIEPNSKQYLEFHSDPDQFIQRFKRNKGYDLSESQLDPTKMRGPGRVIHLADPVEEE